MGLKARSSRHSYTQAVCVFIYCLAFCSPLTPRVSAADSVVVSVTNLNWRILPMAAPLACISVRPIWAGSRSDNSRRSM